MKSQLENNPTPVVQTFTTEGNRKKKVLLFTSDFKAGQILMAELKRTDPVIVETVDDLDRLKHEIARTTPHLLVAHANVDSAAGQLILKEVRFLFPELSVCLVKGDLAENLWQPGLTEVVAKPIRPETPRPYAGGTRMVFHDESFMPFWKGKLNRPQLEKGWEKICSGQEARFFQQLQTARKNHAAAKNYFQCLQAQQAEFDQELAYRLVHGSYKGLSWSRDLGLKWLALLAHYTADAELEYLPRAGSPGPAVDYVHHDASPEAVYVATLLISYQVKPAVSNAIKDLVIARFDGQDDDALLALSLKLYGMAKMLEQVGRAQIELMDAWLDPSIVDRAGDANIPRGEHRYVGIYRDFYDLGFIINSPEPLASVLRGFHAGTTYIQQERFLPSFPEFRRLWRSEELPSDNPAGR